MRVAETNDAEALALRALGWIVSDGDRAQRLLALTGLTPRDLRARIGSRQMLASILGFLEAHEPDLIAAAAAIGTGPERLTSARAELER